MLVVVQQLALLLSSYELDFDDCSGGQKHVDLFLIEFAADVPTACLFQ